MYLITGGLGDLGLLQAEHLARTVHARLVLVGRSGLAPRDEWDDWLARHPSGETQSRKIAQIRALESLGAEVLILSADVANQAAMRGVIAEATRKFGPINGVLHLPAGELVPHTLLGVRTVDQLEEAIFRAQYRADDLWMLHEHRVGEGEAVVPGTGYLELARAAISAHEGTAPDEPIELRDVVFTSPLVVRDGYAKEVQISLAAEENGAYAFSVSSATGDADWEQHARAVVSVAEPPPPQKYDLDAIRSRCDRAETIYSRGEQQTKQEKVVRFGPRWKVLRSIHLGADEALASSLELSPEYRHELAEYAAYPPLLDLATAFALPLIEGYETADDFYVPFSYERVLVRGPLLAKLYSYARLRPASADEHQKSPVYDVVILDELGTPLIEVEGFRMKRVAARALTASRANAAAHSAGGPRTLLDLGQSEGIQPGEGIQALDRLLAAPGSEIGPQVVVTSIDLDALLAEFGTGGKKAVEAVDSGPLLSRPELSGTYIAPRNHVEAQLAGFWQELLGVERAGVDDDFFELGGYSLIAVRLFAKIKKAFGVDLGLETLFRAPTIASCAQLLAEELGLDLTTQNIPQPVDTPVVALTAVASSAPSRAPSTWSPLVAIQVKGSKPAFFCVHGAGGNVLNLRDLSRRLGDQQPFYAFQMQGVDGKLPPLRCIEDMATQYLEQLRAVQSRGPYLLGGIRAGV